MKKKESEKMSCKTVACAKGMKHESKKKETHKDKKKK